MALNTNIHEVNPQCLVAIYTLLNDLLHFLEYTSSSPREKVWTFSINLLVTLALQVLIAMAILRITDTLIILVFIIYFTSY